MNYIHSDLRLTREGVALTLLTGAWSALNGNIDGRQLVRRAFEIADLFITEAATVESGK